MILTGLDFLIEGGLWITGASGASVAIITNRLTTDRPESFAGSDFAWNGLGAATCVQSGGSCGILPQPADAGFAR